MSSPSPCHTDVIVPKAKLVYASVPYDRLGTCLMNFKGEKRPPENNCFVKPRYLSGITEKTP